jgi:hypothetical protein
MKKEKNLMEKTKSALDDLFAGVVGLIPTWCSMLKSTRFLTVLIIVAVLIWAWKYGGLTDIQAEIVSVVGGLIGVNFSWTKTIGKKYETVKATATADAAAADTTGVAASRVSTEPTATYNVPLDIDGYIKGLGASLYDQYDECKSIISNYNLLSIHPTVRVTVAEQVMDKTIDLAKAVWPSLVGMNAATGTGFYRAPEVADYKDYASKQNFDKAVRDAIPGCQYMPEGANVLFRDMEEYYSNRANLTLLEGKPVRWYEADGKTPRIKTIYTLASMGLSAVA